MLAILFLLSFQGGETKPTDPAKAEPKPVETEAEKTQKLSYAFGNQLGKTFSRDKIELDMDAFIKGLSDGMAGNSDYSQQEMMRRIQKFQVEMRNKQRLAKQKEAEANLAKSNAYLEANKLKEGVITLNSGLQYKVLTAGSGKQPTIDDKVKVNYRGTLIDGKEFDSSGKGGEPATFDVKRLVPGWIEALQLMKEGDKWELTLPPKLGYGAYGQGRDIPGNAALVFELELVEVVPKPEAPKKD